MSADCKKNIPKFKKKVGQLVADGIDNTAPVQKILEEFYQKQGQAYSLYAQTIKQRRTTKKHLQNFHFAVPGHSIRAFSADWDGQLNNSFFEAFSHKSYPPKMINTMQHIGESDPVTGHLKLKYDWHHRCFSYRKTAYTNKLSDKFEKLNDDVVRCPKHLVDMAVILDSDPDPYFDSSYNWYYTGSGNVQLVCINFIDYLLHSEFSCLYLTELNKTHMRINQDYAAKFDCGSNILETICSSHHIVALRTRNKIKILKIDIADDSIHFETLKIIGSEVPYTGISFDGYHKQILYVTTLDQNLSIVNLERMLGRSVKLKANIKTLVDNWNTVIGANESFYIHIGRNSISLYDKRSNNVSYAWSHVRNITDEVHCNDISAAKQSADASLLYVSTDHHLLAMDLRYTERDKVSPLQRWTHGMQCVPTYITHCRFEMTKELICMSSQWCEDMCVVPVTGRSSTDVDMSNLTIPYRPPSILKALEEARANKLCSNLYSPIDSRLHTAVTGCLILEQGEKYDVLLQNSLGDLSLHTIFPDHLETFIEDDSPQLLHEWSDSYQLPKKNFEVTSLVDIASILRNLKKVPESYMTGDLKSTMRDKNRFDEKEIFDAFENEELDTELLEIWIKSPENAAFDQSTTQLNFSDSE